MTAKIGTVRMERNLAIKGQKDMRKSNRELTRELAASCALCDKHFDTIIELRAELAKVLTRTDAMIALPTAQTQHGECNECGKKQSDGFALYCVQCADSALIGCQYPLCKSETEQKDIAAQVHAELYGGIPADAKDAARYRYLIASDEEWNELIIVNHGGGIIPDKTSSTIDAAMAKEPNAKP